MEKLEDRKSMRDFINFLRATKRKVTIHLLLGDITLDEWENRLSGLGVLDSEFGGHIAFTIE